MPPAVSPLLSVSHDGSDDVAHFGGGERVRLVHVELAVELDGVLCDLAVASALGPGDPEQGLECVVITPDVGPGGRFRPPPAVGDGVAERIKGVGLGSHPDGLVVGVVGIGRQDAGVAGVRLELDREPFGDPSEDREWEGLGAGAPEDRAPQGVHGVGVSGGRPMDREIGLRDVRCRHVRPGEQFEGMLVVDVEDDRDERERRPRPFH